MPPAFSARVRDFSEALADLPLGAADSSDADATVVYQDACHLLHAQRIRQQPRDVLKAIPGVDAGRDEGRRPLLRQRRHLQPDPA